MELPYRRKIIQKIHRCSQGGHAEGGVAEEDARDRERWR